jgi:hypothetical protein
MLISVIGITKVFIVDYASYIEKQRQDVASTKKLIQAHCEVLGGTTRELAESFLRKGDGLYKRLHDDVDDLVGFISTTILMMLLLFKSGTINFTKKPLLARCSGSHGFKMLFRDFMLLGGVIAVSVACYGLMISASTACMKSMQWQSVAYADTEGSVYGYSLIYLLDSIDQVLVATRVVNAIYYSLAIFIVFVVTVVLSFVAGRDK